MRDANLDNTTSNLRSVTNENFVVPLAKCNLFKGSSTYSGVIIWNSIPVSIKNSSSLPMFVHKCTEWLLIDTLIILSVPPPPMRCILHLKYFH